MMCPHAVQRVPTLGLVPKGTSRLGAMRLLRPRVAAHLGGGSIATGSTDALLLVVGVATAAAASDVRRLLTTAHGRGTLRHTVTSGNGRPSTPL